MIAYFNPYSGTTFLQFLLLFCQRLWLLLSGQLAPAELAADEIQIFVLGSLALSTATLGCFLVLRRMTMLANALSHTILLGIAIVYFIMHLGAGLAGPKAATHEMISIEGMLFAALLMGLTTTFLTEVLNKHVGLQADASIGIVFTSLFALSVILVTLLTRNAHLGTEVVMGNVDALNYSDLKLVLAALAMNTLLFWLFFKEYTLTTFDPGLSKALGISAMAFNYLLMIQVSATTIAGFRAVGVLMVLAMITGPALTAQLLTRNLKQMIMLAAAVGALASLLGVALSRHLLTVSHLALSTSGIVVMVIGLLFAAALIFRIFRCRTS
jgi:manganese/zinc/iron transport system permease protein